MCGRFVIAKELNEIQALFEIDEVFWDSALPNFNIAPTTQVPIFLERPESRSETGVGFGESTRELHSARWGLIPHWAKAIEGSPLLNARIESVLEKPSFRDAVSFRRCAIPASGYYEWQDLGEGKLPHYSHPRDAMFAFAGIYSFWKDPAKSKDDPSRWVLSVAILTKDSAPELAEIHDRNPVFLSPDSLEAWLDPSYLTDLETLKGIASESDAVAAELDFYPVSAAVGSVRAAGEDLIRPI